MSDTELKKSLEREREGLQKIRDELRLQMHLGKAEAKKEWSKLEGQWQQVEQELGRIGHHAQVPLEEIGRATRSLMDELKTGYKRMKNQFKD